MTLRKVFAKSVFIVLYFFITKSIILKSNIRLRKTNYTAN
jgi:hypothetical protein